MRQDQFEKIQAMNESLADVFINEVNPANWPGANQPIDMQDSKIRGDRYWMKKNAVATMTLMQRIAVFVGMVQRGTLPLASEFVPDESGETGETDVSIDNEINKFEKLAAAAIKGIQDNTGKENYDKRVHGGK